MVLDELTEWRRYGSLHPRFAAAFAFLDELPADKPAGRYPIDGEDVFALVQSYQTRPHTQAVFEAHRKYIDIQFIQADRETILWTPLGALTAVTQPYDADKDVAFFAHPAAWTELRVEERQFAIFFPADGHAPCLDCDGRGTVRKVVVKVRA